MDKDRLPKLELDGFTSVARERRTPVRKKRPPAITRRLMAPVKSIKKTAKKNSEEVDIGYKRLMIKTGVCAAIAVVILALSSIDTPVTNSITDTVGEAIGHEFDIEEDIGRLKFVQNLSDDTQGVFAETDSAAVVYPAEGEVITSFGESGSSGVRIVPVGTEIVSIAKGTVTEVGEVSGSGYVKVVLDAGETAVYYNIEPLVQCDDIVQPAQPIGHVQGDYLYLEMTDGGEYIDPITYIIQKAALVAQ